MCLGEYLKNWIYRSPHGNKIRSRPDEQDREFYYLRITFRPCLKIEGMPDFLPGGCSRKAKTQNRNRLADDLRRFCAYPLPAPELRFQPRCQTPAASVPDGRSFRPTIRCLRKSGGSKNVPRRTAVKSSSGNRLAVPPK